MLFTTELELNISIKDINAIYSTNYEQMLMDHAKLMYEGKCRYGQYIKSIDRLVQRSLPNLIKRDLDAKVRIYIVVEATVIRYDQYDFITDMIVTKVIQAGKIGNFDMIECKNDHVIALMKVKKGVEDFKLNDKIVIRVGQSMYRIGNTHILINGFPFLSYVPEPVCFSIKSINQEEKDYYMKTTAPLLQRELARKDKLDQKKWKMFSELLHPYKKEQSANAQSIDLLDLDKFQNGHFAINYNVNMTSLKCEKIDNKAAASTIVINENAKFALTRITYPFIKYLEVVNNLAEAYATDDDFNKVDYLWNLYKESKL